MLSATIKYGAIKAKVMAMYGKLLDGDAIGRLCSCVSLSDLAAALRGCEGWGDSLGSLTARPDADKLKEIVRGRVYEDYGKLWSFCSLSDKKLLIFTVHRAEYSALMHTLRRIKSSQTHMNSAETEFLSRHGSLDVSALNACGDYGGLLSAAEKSIFSATLRALEPDSKSGLPDYSAAAVALENAYYCETFSHIAKSGGGLGQRKLEELLGVEADWLNLVSILRILRHFPASVSRGEELLVPIFHQLKPPLVKKLLAAGSPEGAAAVLSGTSMGRLLTPEDISQPGKLYAAAMEAFCRKLVRLPEPNICTAQAYLTLRELECDKLVRIIEAISCGADPYTAV